MGRYQAYSEYKNSGMEWLGVIPNKWERLKFKFTSKEGKAFASGPFGSSIGSQFYRDSGVPVIRGNNLSLNANKPKFVDDGYVFIDKNKADELSNAEVIRGDLVFTARGTVGQVGLIPCVGDLTWERAILSANQLRFRNHKTGFSSNFLWYLFSSWLIRTQVLLSSDSVAQPNLNLGSLKDLHLLKPSFEEQVSIAKFLDYETAKIDTLIAKQEKLIELLKEKRQAVISHAVTKGLNPNVPMKDSGVEWLGEVPEHWSVMRMRFICHITTGSRDTQDAKDNGEFPFFVRSDTIQRIDSYSFDGEGVMTSGDGAGVGKIFHHFIGKCEIHQRVYLFHKFKKITGRYFYHFLKEHLEPIAIAQSAKSTVDSLRMPILQEFPFAFGSIKEQKEICDYLTNQESYFEKLISKSTKAVDLLKERKTALISAAVTGKIDVRSWQQQGLPG